MHGEKIKFNVCVGSVTSLWFYRPGKMEFFLFFNKEFSCAHTTSCTMAIMRYFRRR